MEIILITSDKTIENETQLITELFCNGLKRLHIRKPKNSLLELIDFVNKIPAVFHQNIVMHQFQELLSIYNLGGFHISQHNRLKLEEIKLLIARHQSLSISCHSFNEIETINKMDYYFISPVYNSISKKNYDSNFTTTELMNGIKNNATKNIVALGGINNININNLESLGFYGAAILGAIWQSKDPIKEFKTINNLFI